MDPYAFQTACEKIIYAPKITNGIGTLGEKTLHAVLKQYYEPHEDYHEIKIGNYVADIVGENGIIEIQTANFSALRKKLITFLDVTSVTVVHPIYKNRWIHWVNPQSGEIMQKRKSPKQGSSFELLFDLYYIRDLLQHPNFTLIVPIIDIAEYRSLDGWSKDKKKGASKIDRIPLALLEELYFHHISDYEQLLPSTLAELFTSKDFAKYLHAGSRKVSFALQTLKTLHLIEQDGKDGRAFLYRKKTNPTLD